MSTAHRIYRGEADIQAPMGLVWKVLMDFPEYPRWNPFNIAMESHRRVGDPVRMRVQMSWLTREQTRTGRSAAFD